MNASFDVLVVGAGLAGLAAARDLTRAGYHVLVLEKSRGVGGRAATKRLELSRIESGKIHLESIVRADHGAQFFTVRGQRFHDLNSDLIARGLVREWTRSFPRWTANGIQERPIGHPRFVCPSGMSTLSKILRDQTASEPELGVELGALVSAVWPSNHGWTAVLENGEMRYGRSLIVNAPAPQSLNLMRKNLNPKVAQQLEAVKFEPCWVVIAALNERPNPGWKGLELEHHSLAWAALDHTKREAEAAPVLVLHTNSDWSQAHLEQRPEQILGPLLQDAQAVLGDWAGHPHVAIAHRWRYARPMVTHDGPFVAQDNLVFCGDWCSAEPGAPRIESAFESGWASAKYLLERVSHSPMIHA